MAELSMLIPNYPKQKRSGLKKAIIHNSAGKASAKQEAIRLRARNQWENGNAHKFIDDKDCVTVINMSLVSYNCGNWDINTKSISYEICKSRGDKNTFLKAEQNTFKVVARDLKHYGKNTDILDLHRNIIATACPHRSQELHGKGKKCLDYFKKEVKRYMSSNEQTNKPKSQKIGTGKFMGHSGRLVYTELFPWDKYLGTINSLDMFATKVKIATASKRNIRDVKTNKIVGYFSPNSGARLMNVSDKIIKKMSK